MLVRALATHLTSIFIKINTVTVFYRHSPLSKDPYVLHFYHKHFVKPLWRLVDNIDNPGHGLYSNNLSRSISYHLIKRLFSRKLSLLADTNTLPSPHAAQLTHYTKPIPTASLSVQKDLYNTTVIYFMCFISNTYVNSRGYFRSPYGFLLLPYSFNIYTFCNVFFFKTRNY